MTKYETEITEIFDENETEIMEDFEFIEGKNYFMKCKKCGEAVPTGIVNVSEHWVNCGGKEFHNAIINNPKCGKITSDDIEELKKIHLK